MRAKSALAMGALVLGTLALAGCAGGGDRGPRSQGPVIRAILSADALVFTSFDTDGDLRISAAELEAGVQHEWSRADTSGDGTLQPLEFGAWTEAALGGNQLPPFRLDFDRNVDNVITAEEFTAELNARAADYDENHDTVLTRAEFLRPLAQTRMLNDGPPQGAQGPAGGQARRRPPR